MAKKS